MRSRPFLAAVLAGAMLTGTAPGAKADVLVLAAASLTRPLDEIARSYSKNHNEQVRVSFAASSTLAKQIARGAPADIYISANPQWIAYLRDRDAIEHATETHLVGNSLVVIVPANSGVSSLKSAAELPRLVGDRRLAIADPDHVPAGIYAKAAMTSNGIWEALRPRLAPGVHVRASLALVERGEVPAGVVYATDAANNARVRVVYRFPTSNHPDISYVAAIVRGHRRPGVRAFFNHLFSSAARQLFAEHGFSVD